MKHKVWFLKPVIVLSIRQLAQNNLDILQRHFYINFKKSKIGINTTFIYQIHSVPWNATKYDKDLRREWFLFRNSNEEHFVMTLYKMNLLNETVSIESNFKKESRQYDIFLKYWPKRYTLLESNR